MAVTTRLQSVEEDAQNSRNRKIGLTALALLIIVAIGTLSAGGLAAVGAAKQISYIFKGTHTHTTGEKAAASWESIKDWASTNSQVLPTPTLLQRIRSVTTRKPLPQIQAEDLWYQTKQSAAEHGSYIKDTASGYASSASSAAGKYRDAASAKAGDLLDDATRRALPTPSLLQRLQSTFTGKTVQQIQAEQLYGDLKVRAGDGAAAGQQKATDLGNQAYESASSAASKAASSAGDAASDAKERIQAMSQESAWDKVKRLASGRTRAEVHYDAAKDAAGDASGHLTQAAHEVYEAVKSAGSVASSGAASAWHADPVGKAGAAINNAAGDVYDVAKPYADAAVSHTKVAKDATVRAASAAKYKAGEVYDSTTGAASETAESVAGSVHHANAQAGLTVEQARHRAEEYALKLKHEAEESLHAAEAEL